VLPKPKAQIQGRYEAAEGRTVRFRGAGYDIFMHLYIDGEFIKTEMLTTK
jgi:hypothetical protein